MGNFLSMTSVIGKNKDQVVSSLNKYAKSNGGGLEKENLPVEHNNCSVIEEANGNTTIYYPYSYTAFASTSEFISRDLSAPAFSFHIYDGDLWMYLFFVNGKTVDQFNPIPDYWEDLSDAEKNRWNGNATIISKYIPSVKPAAIERYLVRWNPEGESKKAYPSDQYEQQDWQLLDFMKKLGLPFPLNDNGKAKGETFKLWTDDLPLAQNASRMISQIKVSNENIVSRQWSKTWW